jgi:hypothetical protein
VRQVFEQKKIWVVVPSAQITILKENVRRFVNLGEKKMASFDALGPGQTLDASFCRSFFLSILDLPVILDLHFGSDTIKTTRLIKNRRVDNTFK